MTVSHGFVSAARARARGELRIGGRPLNERAAVVNTAYIHTGTAEEEWRVEYSGVGGGGSRTIIIILKGTRARKGNCCWQEESTSPELYTGGYGRREK